MSNRYLEPTWKKYQEVVLRQSATVLHQQAFYAGARAVFRLVEMMGDPSVSEETVDLALEKLRKEFEDFDASFS